MKVVFFSLNSSWVHTNLAVRCLRSALEQNGFEAEIFECTAKDNRSEVLFELAEKKADMYGFSCYIWNIEETLKIAENLKQLLPECKIIFGGPEVSYHGVEFFEKHPFVDKLISGEGEDAFIRLCRNYGEERIIHGAPYGNFENEGILYHTDEKIASNIVYYESSRGCPYKCSYCLSSLHTHPAVRFKSVEKTLADLLEFEKFEGIKIVKFIDRTFNFDKERAKALWTALLDEKYTKNYHFEICASLVDASVIKLLSRFPKGKIQLEIGVQSTNTQTLCEINRRDNPKKVCSVIEKLHNLGNMHIHADLIAGLPYEDYNSFGKSFNDLWGKCDMLQLGFLKLLNGSPIKSQIEEFDYKYTVQPPYEILSNKFLPYSDVIRLKRIEAVLERYANSGKFAYSIKHLTCADSPFAIFEKLSDFVKSPTALSQRDAYISLYNFAQSLGVCDNAFKSKLRFDFLLNETSRVPTQINADEPAVPDLVKSNFIHSHPEIFVPSLEAHIFDFDSQSIYFIDRKNKCFFKEPNIRTNENKADI